MLSSSNKPAAIAPVLISALAVLATPALAKEAPGEGKSIIMARGDWDTGWFHAEIYRQLIEKLGYEVREPMTLSTPPFYTAVSQGDVDFWVNSWFPMHNDFKKDLAGRAEPVGASIAKGGIQGFIVDKQAVEEFGLKTLADFSRPDVKEAFDRNGDGKADLVGCQLGWACEEILDKKIKAYGLDEDFNTIKAKYPASFAAALSDYEDGKHVLLYAWMPNWTFSSLKLNEDVVWIPVPETDKIDDPEPVEGIEGCISDPCRIGYAANDITPFANTEFLKENPAVAKLFEEVRIPVADVNAQNAAMRDGDKDIEKQASDWIMAHESDVEKWLKNASSAAE